MKKTAFILPVFSVSSASFIHGSMPGTKLALNNVAPAANYSLKNGNLRNDFSRLRNNNLLTVAKLSFTRSSTSKNRSDDGGSVKLTKLSDPIIEGKISQAVYKSPNESSLIEAVFGAHIKQVNFSQL